MKFCIAVNRVPTYLAARLRLFVVTALLLYSGAQADTEGPLEVAIDGPTRIEAGKVVEFTPKVKGGVAPYTYFWKTDGKVYSSNKVILDYDRPGVFGVQLEVRDANGLRGQATLTVEVSYHLAVNIHGPRKVKLGSSATYAPMVVTGPDSGYSYNWQFEQQSSTAEEFEASFDSPGEKTMLLTVQHPQHGSYRSRATITVSAEEVVETAEPKPLTAIISGPTTTEVGLAVSFTPTVEGGSPPYRFNWTLAGRQIPQKSISGNFKQPGEYILMLSVWDQGKYRKRPYLSTISVEVRRPAQADSER